jgi:hypothetical protein
MWTQIAPFSEAEHAYRRERIMYTYPHMPIRQRRRHNFTRPIRLGRRAHSAHMVPKHAG